MTTKISTPLLVIVGVALVAGAYFYMFNNASPTLDESDSLAAVSASQRENCFSDELLLPNINKSGWKTFEGSGFSFRYPENLIKVYKKSGILYIGYNKPTEPTEAAKVEGVLTLLTHVNVNNLEPVTRLAGNNYKVYSYTLKGNKWEMLDYYAPFSDGFKRCKPNASGKTMDNKNAIYTISAISNPEGIPNSYLPDPYLFKSNFVSLRNVPRGSTQLVVEFSTSYKGDPSEPTYPAYLEFQRILDNIARTVKARPQL